MFQTYNINKQHSPFCRDGEHVWDLVSFVLNQPWFHVTFLVTGDHGDEFERSVMLKEVHQIVELSQRNDLKLRFVDVVSPGFVNGSGRWKMEPLEEVWLCKQEDHLNEYRYDHVYILESGEKYSSLATPPEDKNCKRGCPEFCVNGFSINSIKSVLRTGWRSGSERLSSPGLALSTSC